MWKSMWEKAMVCGIIDGGIETGYFVKTIGDVMGLTLKYDPWQVTSYVEFTKDWIYNLSFDKAMKIRDKGQEDLAVLKKSLPDLTSEQFWKDISYAVKEGTQEILGNEGTTQSGYTTGKFVFDIILGEITAGGGSVSRVGKVPKLTKQGAKTLYENIKNPRKIAEASKNALLKVKNSDILGKFKLSRYLKGNKYDWIYKVRVVNNGSETCLEHIKRLHLQSSGVPNKSFYFSQITEANLPKMLDKALDDWAFNSSNVKFIKDGYDTGKHWLLVDMTKHPEFLNSSGYIGKYISASGKSISNVHNVLITINDNLEMINALPTNKSL